jgi:hypothetical protein
VCTAKALARALVSLSLGSDKGDKDGGDEGSDLDHFGWFADKNTCQKVELVLQDDWLGLGKVKALKFD